MWVQRVCSLKTDVMVSVPSKTYTVVRFTEESEQHDPDAMHMGTSGLVNVEHDAWATMQGFMVWETQSAIPSADRFTHVRHRFSRDPFGENDTTATNGLPAAPSSYTTAYTLMWNFFVHPGTPLAYMVWHNAPKPRKLIVAEFKVSYTLWIDE